MYKRQRHLKAHGESSEDKKCLWDNCSVKRETKISLLSHLDVHVDFPLYNCKQCGSGFKRVHDLKRHVDNRRCPVLKTKKAQNNLPSLVTSMKEKKLETKSRFRSPMDIDSPFKSPFLQLNPSRDVSLKISLIENLLEDELHRCS